MNDVVLIREVARNETTKGTNERTNERTNPSMANEDPDDVGQLPGLGDDI